MEFAAASEPGPRCSSELSGELRSKQRDWLEIGVAFALIEAVEWTPRPWQRWLWIVAALGIAFLIWRSFEGWTAMGFRTANLRRSLWIVAAAAALAAAAILLSARAHALLMVDGIWVFPEVYGAYSIWSGVQQILLQGFFLLRMLRVMPKTWQAELLAAAMFAAAHIPNPILVSLTLVWGFLACMLFVRYRNLYPLMFAHALLGITIAMTIPGPVVHNMRVGLAYLTYHPHLHAQHTHVLSQP
ncbi:MAG TPA: CPBP family glutamic-type intramembrane protease [Terracidiphilus sp.]|nr:CPBP family glutamic-type intramembrane protease [Terracidiphilus sp.]